MKLSLNLRTLLGLIALVCAVSAFSGCKKADAAADTAPTTKPATAATNTTANNTQSQTQASTDEPKDPSDATSDRATEDDASKGRRAEARKSLGL